MSDEQKRAYLKKAYSGKKWADKVDKMSSAQLHSTYMRVMNSRGI